jgi:thioredoxin 1
MLRTNLDHLETPDALQSALKEHENVMICCGRMGPMCLPVYAIMDGLKNDYPHISFFDQDFDGLAASTIQGLPQCAGFMGLPFTVYFKKGAPVAATSSIQTHEQVVEILDREFGSPA